MTASSAPIYDNFQEIIEKIKKNDVMTGKDKYLLQYNINEVLTPEEHVEVFKIIVQNTGKKVYSTNTTSTYLDLTSLNNSVLWRLHYYVNFCLKNRKKTQDLEKIHRENDLNKLEFEQKIQEEFKKKQETGEIPLTKTQGEDAHNKLYTFENMPSYSTLRDQAIYQASPALGESLKMSQMKHLNSKLQITHVLNTDEVPEESPNNFFRSYKDATEVR